MEKNKIIIASVAVVSFGVIFSWLRSNVRSIPGLHNANPVVVQIIALLLGLVGLAVLGWLFMLRQPTAKPAEAAEAGEGSQNLDDLIYEAETRLSEAQNDKDSKISKLPAVFLVGESGSAKTSTMVNSGLDPELLSGQVYAESKLVETPTVNFWFARHTLFVETAGKLLSDTSLWRKLIAKMQPGKLASVMGTAEEAPRAALVCVDAESLTSPDADAVNTAARNLRTRLSEISQLLGVNLPVYVLFTRTDRTPFFAEYVKNLNNEEAVKILGKTLLIVGPRQGVYSEEETSRLSAAFESLFRSLCNARPEFLSREGDAAQLPGIYEFPREFRKLRSAAVRFLVEMCRPSQLTVGPFLRGFYFSGVRPIVVNELAPVVAPHPQEKRGGPVGATGMFRQGAGLNAPQPAAQRIVGTRKVPQWLFLGHFFNDLLLADQVAKGASATSAKASLPRRILLACGSAICLLYCAALAGSFAGNRALETKVQQAASGISPAEPAGLNAASLNALQKLEILRQTLVNDCRKAPWTDHFGLYVGNTVCPEVRQLYFATFQRLLLNPVRNVMLESLRQLPPTPGPGFEPTYYTLKAYLITTSNHDKTDGTLSPTLLDRWSANRNIDQERKNLARLQFDFYADQLKQDRTSSENDAAAIEKARVYLANNFENLDVKYQQLLVSAAKAGAPVRFEDSAHVVTDAHEVPAAFSKEGWEFVKTALKTPAQYDTGDWVLGNKKFTRTDGSGTDQPTALTLANRYYSDFVKQWIAYLEAANVTRYSNLADAASKLDTLTGNGTPLIGLLWLAAKNTAVDRPEVANVFLPVQTVVPSTGGPSVAPPNDGYIDRLSNLKKSVKVLADQPQGDIKDVLQNASDAEDAVNKVTRFRADAARNADQAVAGKDVDRFLREPITFAENLVKALGPGELNAKGKAFCQPYRALTSKYPFNPNPSAPAASLADVDDIFKKPGGALWKLYNENLQKLLPLQGTQYVPAAGPAALNPAFVAFFNQAAAISEFFYAGGAQEPHFNYTVKVAQLDRMPGAILDLEIDGQEMSYSGGNAAPKSFAWQAGANHEVKATAKLGQVSLAWGSDRSSKGLWSLFEFLGEGKPPASGNPNWFGWNVGITGSRGNSKSLDETAPAIWLEVDLGGPARVFQKGFISLPGCVAEVAK
jgi:type VI secretion system protein ImpL